MYLGATILGSIIFVVMGVLLYLAQADKLGDNTRPAIFLVLGLLPVGMFCAYLSYQPEDAPHFEGPQIAQTAGGKKAKKKNPFGKDGGDGGEDDYADEAGSDKGRGAEDGGAGKGGSGGPGGGGGTPIAEAKAKPKENLNIGQGFQDCDDCPMMVVVPAGYYTMGAADSDNDASDAERPQVRVKIARRLAVGKFEITVGQFDIFVRETKHPASSACDVAGRMRRATFAKPGFQQDQTNPAVCVSWNDAQAYTTWLGAKVGKHYRLLTASEWEYAARAESMGIYSFGNDLSEADANFNLLSSGTKTIGSYGENKFKVADMHGNAAEWVEDCWSVDLSLVPPSSAAYSGGGVCSARVVKGGSWRDKPADLRLTARRSMTATLASDAVGFRVARSVNDGPPVVLSVSAPGKESPKSQ